MLSQGSTGASGDKWEPTAGLRLAAATTVGHGARVPTFDQSFTVRAPLPAVREFHSSPEALRTLTPPPVVVRLHRFGRLKEGMEAEFTLWMGPFPIHWTARHEQVGPHGFDDVQVSGPMKAWRHQHRFEAVDDFTTRIHDHIDYEHDPRRPWTRLLFGGLPLALTFRYRQWVTRRSLLR
jgi:ligand-binding SRPBCC domain-containing protein